MRRANTTVLWLLAGLTGSGCSLISGFDDLKFGPYPDSSSDAAQPEQDAGPNLDAGDSAPDVIPPDAPDAAERDTAMPLPDTGPDADTGTADEAGADVGLPDTDMGPPPDDAGNDAFVDPDTGPLDDAGPLDSGPDAWSDPDTGPEPDAFVDPDTGPTDSGPPDTGPEDAGPPDSGPADTGPEDTGPPDAGPDTPCADGSMPAQIYSATMVGCDAPATSQCAAAAACGPGWHMCTWSEYLAGGGMTTPSNGTTGRWIRSCRREIDGVLVGPTDEFCTSCGMFGSDVITVGNLCPAGNITEGDYPLGIRTTVEPLITRRYDAACAFAMAIRPSFGGVNGAVCCQ